MERSGQLNSTRADSGEILHQDPNSDDEAKSKAALSILSYPLLWGTAAFG